MRAQRGFRGLAFLVVMCGVVAWRSDQASAAEHLIYVQGTDSSNGNCLPSASSTYYFDEGWGYDAFGNKLCEISEMVGSGLGWAFSLGTCSPGFFGAATQHRALITIRQVNSLTTGPYSLVSVEVQGPLVSSWGSQSSAGLNASGPRCPGATLNVWTNGIDTTSTP
jgi:hypothetical protein